MDRQTIVEEKSRRPMAGTWGPYPRTAVEGLKVHIDCNHAIVLAGLELALRELGFQRAPALSADIIIRDFRGSNCSGPLFPVPTLALVDDTSAAIRALRMGYLGYLTPEASIDDVSLAAHVIRRGEHWAERRVLVMALANSDANDIDSVDGRVHRLTRREHEVLQRMLRGSTNIVIAKELGISPKTVKGHVSVIYGKLQVRDRKELLIALA